MKDNYTVLPISEYLDKTTAGFLGQLVGFFSGYEFVFTKDGKARVAMPDEWFEMCNGPYANPNPHKKHSDKLLFNEDSGLWEAWNDDDYSIDILNQYILRDMYAEYGTVVSKLITDGWAKYNVYDMGGGNRQRGAYALMSKYHYLPEFAGSYEFGNRYSYCYEPCIENETLGMNAACMPNTAAKLSEKFAVVTSDQDPVVWTRFLVVMYSLAYTESDIPTLIRKAQAVLPPHSFASRVVDRCFELFAEHPSNWRKAVIAAEKEFLLSHDRMVHDTMLEPNVNTSFVILSLLYGNGDYRETCKIVSLAGYDGDSTSAICMGIMGILCGMAHLPKEAHELLWQNGEGVVVNLPYPNVHEGYWMCALGLPERIKIKDIVKLYQKNFESVLLEKGGRIEDGNYIIPRECLGSVDSVCYEDFEGGSIDSYTVCGEAELVSGAFEGKYTAKVNGEMYREISRLQKGEKYRVVCYVNTDEDTKATLFVRDGARETKATVFCQRKYIRRSFDFTATNSVMQFGIRTCGKENGFATLDHITVFRISERTVGATTVADNVITVFGKGEREVLLKLTFANTADETVNVSFTVNGDDFNVAPFYRTGEADENSADVTYIPILLSKDKNTVTLTPDKEGLRIINAETVVVNDLF